MCLRRTFVLCLRSRAAEAQNRNLFLKIDQMLKEGCSILKADAITRAQ